MSRSYTLARLRRDRPDLAHKVEAGELSTHAAAIQAGFRKGAQTPFEIAQQLVPKLSSAERAELKKTLAVEEPELAAIKTQLTRSKPVLPCCQSSLSLSLPSSLLK